MLRNKISGVVALVIAASGVFASPPAEAASVTTPPSGRPMLGVFARESEFSTFESLTGSLQPPGQKTAIRATALDWDANRSPGETWADRIAMAEGRNQALDAFWSPASWDRSLGTRRENISPGAISRGEGDAVVLDAAQSLKAAKVPVLLRFGAEMNGWWHPYSAYNRDGSKRDADHSTVNFKRAWQRIRTVFRGGSRADVNGRLAALGQPPLQADSPETVGAPEVKFLWAVNAASHPRVDGQHWRNYYPGDAYVDWVGVDVFDDGPWNYMKTLVDAVYDFRPSKPFSIPEWGIREHGVSLAQEDARDVAFVNNMFNWIEAHPRVASAHWFESMESKLTETVNAAAMRTYRQRVANWRYLGDWRPAQWRPVATAIGSTTAALDRYGRVPVTLRCSSAGMACSGTLAVGSRTLQSPNSTATSLWGRKAFTLSPGRQAVVYVPLSSRVRDYFKAQGTGSAPMSAVSGTKDANSRLTVVRRPMTLKLPY